MNDPFIYCCPRCGQIFESISTQAVYCPACRPVVQHEKTRAYYLRNRDRICEESREQYRTTKHSSGRHSRSAASIGEICRRAAEMHMTYGEYVAKFKE